MKMLVATLMLLLPSLSVAQTYLCVAEAGAVVEDGAVGAPASAAVADVSASKYIVTKESGAWVVKQVGAPYVLFNQCSPDKTGESFLCKRSTGFAGEFFKQGNKFSVVTLGNDNGRSQWGVAKGSCSSISLKP